MRIAAGWRHPLARGPAVIAARDHDIDLLPRRVADVACPERAGLRIEAKAPRIAEAVGEDLRPLGSHAHERVVLRDRAVQVEAQELAIERLQILRIRVHRRAGTALVITHRRVAHAHVELAVRADPQAPAVVLTVALRVRRDAVEQHRGRAEGSVSLQHRLRYLVHARARLGHSAVDIEISILLERGIDCEAEEPLFARRAHREGRERRHAPVEHLERTGLLGDHQPAVGEKRDGGGLSEAGHVCRVRPAGHRRPGTRRDGKDEHEKRDGQAHARRRPYAARGPMSSP